MSQILMLHQIDHWVLPKHMLTSLGSNLFVALNAHSVFSKPN